MRQEELNHFLREYSEKEKLLVSGAAKKQETDPVYSKFKETETNEGVMQKTYLFEDEYFLMSYESIGINRQDRFEKVHPHMHNYIELTYLWSGKSSQTVNGEQIILNPGDICILDTNAVHSIEQAEEDDIIVNILMRKEFFTFTFFNRLTKQGALAEFLINAVTKKQNKEHYLIFRSHGSEKVRRLMSELFCEYWEENLGKREVLESYLVILFTELLRIYQEHAIRKENTQRQQVRLLSILQYIERNYETCNLSSAAKDLGVNEKYLTMMLKEKTGRSFVEHLQEQKLNKAKILLAGTDIPVSEAVAQCGYSNVNFFYQKFKKSTGYTPAQYRKFIRELS